MPWSLLGEPRAKPDSMRTHCGLSDAPACAEVKPETAGALAGVSGCRRVGPTADSCPLCPALHLALLSCSCAPSCRRRRSSNLQRCYTSTAMGPLSTSSASTCGSSTGTAASSCCLVSGPRKEWLVQTWLGEADPSWECAHGPLSGYSRGFIRDGRFEPEMVMRAQSRDWGICCD